MSELIDPVEFAQKLAPILRGMVEPLEARIAELEGRDPVKEILATDKLETLVSLEVAAWLEQNPPEKGDPGAPGKDGADGNDGRDGLDVKDLFRADGGHLIAVMSDGTTKDLGQFVGKDGRDGVDGLGFEDATLEVVDGQAVVKLSRGDVVKSLAIPMPTMKHIGFWQQGMSAKASETTTHDGSLWLALRDTAETPAYNSKDWQLAARKGADGQRGKDGKDYRPPAPVKLGG